MQKQIKMYRVAEANHLTKWLQCLLSFFLSIMLSSSVLAAHGKNKTADLTDIKIVALDNGKIHANLIFNNTVSIPKSFSTKSPARIIIDFKNVGVALAEKKRLVDIGVLRSFKIVQASGSNRVRLVFNLKQNANYKVVPVSAKPNQVTLVLSPESPEQKKLVQDKFAANKWVKVTHYIKGVDFRRDKDDGGRVIVTLSDASMGINVTKNADTIVVDFLDTHAPKRLQRRLDVTDFGTPVQTVATKGKGSNVQMVVKSTGSFSHLAYQVNDQFVIDVSPEAEDSAIADQEEEVRYTGEHLSLNFQNISVRAVLQLLAEFTGINIVASDSVKGNMTLRLNNVPWDEALAIILRTQGLAQRKVGNVLMIAPSEEVAAREREDLESKREVKELEPLITELIQLNYAKASETSTLLKDSTTSLLSPRGNVSIDGRTNTLLVQDTLESVVRVRELIERLDVPVKQVLIEARIVNVDTNFEKNLGIQFGVTRPSHITGTLNGANRMQQNILNGDNPLLNLPVADRLNINLPAAPSSGAAGSLGIALAKLSKDYLLDLEISALETEGVGELVSSPRLVTANQQEASIEQGEEIPYQEATSSGATAVEFKKAVLSLRVIPQITPDGKVILDLKINQDRRSSEPEVLGVPAIATQQIETRVLVDNGQTIVLGGVYQEDKQNTMTRIPFLGNLPIIGYLFRNTDEVHERRELLIFITPKIIQQTSIT